MQGAINTARYGWPVTQDLVRYMALANASAQVPDFLSKDPNWAIDFAPNGTLVKLGDTITRKRYADTLETIANSGPDAFYHGPIAETTIKALQAQNGTMTLADLKNYTVAIRPPANITYRGYKIYSCSAPSGGEVALSALNIVSGYNDFFEGTVNLSTHRMDEAMRFAYGQRSQLGDPSFLANISAYQNEMLSAATGVRSSESMTSRSRLCPKTCNGAGPMRSL